jgi:2-methylcitrate dehydratase PrpD
MTAPSLTQRMGRLVAETIADSLPTSILIRAKVSLLHNLAVALAGRSRETIAHVTAERFWGAPAESTLLFNGAGVSLEAAAFANAVLMNARSQDDTHAASTSHPGSPTIAAALAVAEAGNGSGVEFLTATVLGYEILCRIGRDFDHLFTERGFRAAAILGGFGAAAAAARLMRCSAQETTHALGLAANLSGGLAQVWREGSSEGPLQLGFAARNGIVAVRCAVAGATSAVHALEGESGFFRAYGGASRAPDEALDGIGVNWQLHEVTVKPLPVCAILQGPVGLFLDLVREHSITPQSLAEISVELSPYEAGYPGIDYGGPFSSSIATKMSAQFCLALAALHGRVTPDGLGRVTDDALLAMSRRVRVGAVPELQPRRSRITVRLVDGRRITGSVDTPVGQPSFEQAACFARSLAPEIGVDERLLGRLAEEVAGLEQASSVRGLVAVAVACGGRRPTLY